MQMGASRYRWALTAIFGTPTSFCPPQYPSKMQIEQWGQSEVLGHSHPTCCNKICLNFLVGMLKHSLIPTHVWWCSLIPLYHYTHSINLPISHFEKKFISFQNPNTKMCFRTFSATLIFLSPPPHHCCLHPLAPLRPEPPRETFTT